MTDLLVKMFEKEFPNIGGVSDTRISIYGADERVYLTLNHKVLADNKSKRPFIKIEEITNVANNLFTDINFDLGEFEGPRTGYIILFRPLEINDYSRRHAGHSIKIHEPYFFPEFTISTGNRGDAKLHKRQRLNYFNFVKAINETFITNARKP